MIKLKGSLGVEDPQVAGLPPKKCKTEKFVPSFLMNIPKTFFQELFFFFVCKTKGFSTHMENS